MLRSPECHNKRGSALVGYNTRSNDIWSLGVILVNLVCGRNPWKQASLEDETFKTYINNPRLLESILPISPATAYILRYIFVLDPGSRMDIGTLKSMVAQTTVFSQLDLPIAEPPSKWIDDHDEQIYHPRQRFLSAATASPTLPSLVPQRASCSSDDEMMMPVTPYTPSPLELSRRNRYPCTHGKPAYLPGDTTSATQVTHPCDVCS
jgi:serine/threonine protein kinase